MPVIKIEDIAHVRFAAPRLAEMRGFLLDFGFETFEQGGKLYGRGSDGRPFLHVTEPGEARFLAVGLRAASVEDLETLAQAEGVSVEPFDAPGGGHVVQLIDPNGYQVEVVAGQEVGAPTPPVTDTPHNTATAKPRLREPIRLQSSPAHIQRIGHAVLRVKDFRASEAWYKARFGLLTSDEIEAAKDVPLGAFLRCDRGDVPSDHHTLFLAQLPGPPGLLHAAFEVADLDDLMLGHQHLKAAGRKAAWGVGRHIMGSQIFDYWLDPFGNELEHWTDGDLFTAADPPNKQTMQALLAVQWGTPHPMQTGRLAPPVGLVAFVMALRLRVLRLFSRKPEGNPA
ncbi:putative 2,3-dihydroxybiphenyl-1,2-dioxygenase or glyoxalase/bleomycin resistance protein [Novosphingobium sediminis]|uniref:Putative 2,3-dihydroxybiphenyl-1,2-dioxygenase or glyoxalase/bleomycin resistance protein n=1 Tax=Novosphingobium sediminis TaxID=707214 RepID=A0A512AG26_9SPHN|nr:VOC family protein [Novosphingobium sediminis]GEN98650.1 putative 2,3-dihydroxybiphenyl-1,2-dioxygenase or glyoxalase/bleomycin resistance protein [Novosphingobium sediminis]